MPTATLERPSFPKTVTACHAEIIRLRGAADGLVSESDRIADLEAQVKGLKEELSDAEDENERLEEVVKELGGIEGIEIAEAVNNFLYEVETPVGGGFKFDVIHGASADRAILKMFDAVGRQP